MEITILISHNLKPIHTCMFIIHYIAPKIVLYVNPVLSLVWIWRDL